MRLEVRRPPRSPEQPAPRITVDLHTDHPALGDLWIRAGLDAPSLVDLTVWASRPGVARRAREFSPLLLRELQRFGLRAGRLEIFEGAKPSAGEPVAGPPSGSLINVEA